MVPGGRHANGDIVYLERTFKELESESTTVARYLRNRGVERGRRVLLMVRPGLDLILITFALFKLGAVPVIIDPGMGLRSFLRCVRRSRPAVLVGIPLAHLVRRIFRSPFRSLEAAVRVRGKFFAEEARQAVGEPDREPFSEAPTRAHELAAILFTSGSTGPPKGVAYEHAMFEAQVRLIRNQYGIEPAEIDLPMLPVFALFNPALGITTVVPEMNPSRPARVDPARIVQAINQCRVTNSFGSPVLWSRIGSYCKQHRLTLPSLRRILMAGAPVSPALIADFRDILDKGEIHTPYGATECLPVTSISGSEILNETQALTEQGRGTCVGRPVAEMEVRTLPIRYGIDAADHAGRQTDLEAVGDIVVSGPVVTRKYDRLAAATRRAKLVLCDGKLWHRMGDVGYLDRDGRLWFCGRKAESVSTSSGLLFTDCCEAVFNRHPDVFRTALIGLGPAGNQVPAIVVQPNRGKYPGNRHKRMRFRGELRELGRERPHTAGIEHFFFCSHFPVDVRHNAKIHRLTLARRFARHG